MTTENQSIKIRRSSKLTGALFLSIAQAVLLGLGYITHILIGKLGGPPLYGVFGVVLNFMNIINMLLTLGIPVAMSKELAEDEENSGGIFKTAIKAQFIFALLLSLLTLIFSKQIALAFGDTKLATAIEFTALVYPCTALYSIFSNYFNGLHAFAIQASLIVAYSIFKLIGSVSLLERFGVTGALSGFAIGAAIVTIPGIFLSRKTIKGRTKRPVKLNKLLTFAGAFVGTSIALQILMSIDLFMVKRFLHDDTLAGYYNAASTLSRIPYFILQALGFVFLPSVARLMKQDVQKGREFIKDISRYLFLLLLPVTALAAATSKGLIHLFYSREYEPGSQPLTLLMVALGLLATFYLFASISAGAGKPKVPLYISWVLLPLSLTFGYFLIPEYKLEGAAITTIIVSAIGATTIGIYMFKRFSLSFPLKTLFNGILATAIAVTPTYFLKLPNILLPLEYLALIVLYLLVLFFLGELKKDDLSHLKTLTSKKTADQEGELIIS